MSANNLGGCASETAERNQRNADYSMLVDRNGDRILTDAEHDELLRAVQYAVGDGGSLAPGDSGDLADAAIAVVSAALRERLNGLPRAERVCVLTVAVVQARAAARAAAGFIYIIEAVGLSRVKIGRTADYHKRLINLQTSSPVPLRLMAFRSGGTAAFEQELHEQFAADRIQGEWFNLSPAITALASEWNGGRSDG